MPDVPEVHEFIWCRFEEPVPPNTSPNTTRGAARALAIRRRAKRCRQPFPQSGPGPAHALIDPQGLEAKRADVGERLPAHGELRPPADERIDLVVSHNTASNGVG